MYEEPNGALMHGLAAQSQPLERNSGRGRAVRINLEGPKLRGKCTHDASRPALQRVRQSVDRLEGFLEAPPLQAAREAQQHDGPGEGTRQGWIQFARMRMKCAADSQAERVRPITQLIE